MISRSSITAALLAAMSGTATAAGPPSDSDLIEEVVVTAQKRTSALQDAPFAVATASEQQICDSGSTNIGDLSRNLALDRERGTRARVGYLTNMPRTYGVSLRFHF